jgi:hypothetical protein
VYNAWLRRSAQDGQILTLCGMNTGTMARDAATAMARNRMTNIRSALAGRFPCSRLQPRIRTDVSFVSAEDGEHEFDFQYDKEGEKCGAGTAFLQD